MLKIYGFKLSTPSNKVEMCANALGIDYTFIPIDLANQAQQQTEYLAIHPAGKVPAIDDDGFILFESNAIIRYLANKTQSDYYPSGLHARAQVDQWMDFSSGQIATNMARIVFNTLFAPKMGLSVDERALADGQNFLARYLPVIERQLNKHAYLAGEQVTLADIVLLSCLDPAELVKYDLSPYPALVTWREQLRSQSFYQKVHQHYGESLMAGQSNDMV